MAVSVLVKQLSPSEITVGAGVKTQVYVTVALIADYKAEIAFEPSISVLIPDAESEQDAIEKALRKVERLAEQMQEGAREARHRKPAGG